jgi:hypothetical protein
MKLPRFRVRALMIAVAVVGFGLAVTRMQKLSAEYARQADGHAFLAGVYRVRVHVPLLDVCSFPPARRQKLASREDALAAKYRRAARYPWLPVEPDPQEPE